MKNLTIYRFKKKYGKKRITNIYIRIFKWIKSKKKIPSKNIKKIGNYIRFNIIAKETKNEITEDDDYQYYDDSFEQSLMDGYDDDLDYDQQDPNFW